MICLYYIIIVACISLLKAENTEASSTGGEPKVIKEEDVTKMSKSKSYGEDNMYVSILIFEGAQFRTAVSNPEKLWKDGVVPFEISDDYKGEMKELILDAMKEFHNKTCIRFKPKKDENAFIVIGPGRGCSSEIGKSGNETKVTLSEACFVKGIVLHELMHALGFVHEQNRPDRDEFVRIDFGNIREGAEINFNKYSENEALTFNQTYDYGSILHYGAFDFAKNKNRPTIIPRKDNVQIGQREGFSEKDIIKINLLYKCDEKRGDVEPTTPTSEADDMVLTTTTSPAGDMILPTRTFPDLDPISGSKEDDKTEDQIYGWYFIFPFL